MVVEEQVGPLRRLRKLLDLGNPLRQLLLGIEVIVPLVRLLVLPPLRGIATVEADIADGRGRLHDTRHQPLQARLIHAAEAELQVAQQRERPVRDPAGIPELDDDRQVRQRRAELLQRRTVLRRRPERPGELAEHAAQHPTLRQRLQRGAERPE